jgi:hypothetical protein
MSRLNTNEKEITHCLSSSGNSKLLVAVELIYASYTDDSRKNSLARRTMFVLYVKKLNLNQGNYHGNSICTHIVRNRQH